MRVHRLRVEAFGPFAGVVDLDLDALAAEGLFLIHGPTGAGKTSLLDAICYALYADVPGARSKKGLRSDHAPEGAAPEVTLEFTAGHRRLRIVRSPEFSRPKKRGTGQLAVNARVTLEERLGSEWVTRGTRNDEVADLVKDVLGMGMAQFASVVLLPQGDFATFLRASPEDRRAVLERLFDITDYRDVEDWLAQARRDARADLEQARSVLAAELTRVEDVIVEAGLGVESPAAPAPGALDSAAGAADTDTGASGGLSALPPEGVSDRLSMLLIRIDATVSSTMTAYDDAASAERRAAAALERGRVLADLRARGEHARRDLEELVARGEEQRARAVAVAAAERASGLEGHFAARTRSATDLEVAISRADSARASLSALGIDVPTDADVAAMATAVRAQDATVVERRRVIDEASLRDRRAADLTARSTALDVAHEEVRGALERAEQSALDLDAQVEHLTAEASTAPALALRLETARASLNRFDAAETERAAAASLVPARDGARTISLDRRQDLLDLRARRLDQMAGELAASLSHGAPCPVCGSADHPELASTTDPVRPDDLVEAESRLEAAEQAHRTLHDEVQAHLHRAATLQAMLDATDRVTLDASVLQLTRALDAAHESVAQRDTMVARALSHGEQTDAMRREAATVLAQRTSVAELLTSMEAEQSAALVRLRDLEAAHHSCPCATADGRGHAAAGVHLASLQAAVEDLDAARGRAAGAEADLVRAVTDAGFDDAETAQAFVLPREDLARERSLLSAHRERIAAAERVTHDPEVAAALAGDPPDIPTLLEAAHSARDSLLTARTAADDAERTRRSMQRLVPVVTAACSALARASARDTRVREVADTVGGTGPENTLRMRLTSFVLAARLEKVARLANERLAVMGGGRYLLEHSDDLAARGARSGLGLRVLDQWTGRARDTATLSGGESFMASLALALGLADAVREEAGGFDLGTLFVDEGFGTLDDDSLEQVVTVLDGLREGGRAVGVVSHVADLRSRITHQAIVHKGPAGSTVEIRAGATAEPAA